MPDFSEQGVLVNQFFGHNGMVEIYVHLVASGILFTISLISFGILFIRFRKAGVQWPGIIHGFLYASLFGFGELMDHFLY